MNRTAAAIAAVAIPDPGPALDVERMNVAAVLARLEQLDDLQEADEYRLRAQALASYLANRLDPGPANRIANMAAVRIGELLGPAEMGEHSKGRLGSTARELDKSTRSQFRLMARYRSTVEESAHLSRSQVLEAVARRRDEERRLAQLPADLADRVVSESDPITLADAEAVVTQRHERLTVWVSKIQDALLVLGRMAGDPVPAQIAQALDDDDLQLLTVILSAIKGRIE